MPSSIEDLLQSIGRASRDGEPSQAYILYDNDDVKLWKFLFTKTVDKSNQVAKAQKLNDVTKLLRSRACLRRQIVEYFGQEYIEDNCGSCSNCVKIKVR